MIEVVAEIGINANGDVNIAKRLIDLAVLTGIQYVKFQKRTISLVYSKEELDTPRDSPWGTTTRRQKEGLEFNEIDYMEIDTYCKERGIKWFGSPWDNESAFFLGSFDVPFIKIPSALITKHKLLALCRDIGKPIILSTGMSTVDMIDDAINVIGQDKIYCIMQCTSTYPTKPEDVDIECINTLRNRYPWAKIGFSNHYPGLMSMFMAATVGVDMIEFHITLDRSMYGSDQAASIEPVRVHRLMEGLKLIDLMRGCGEKYIRDSEMIIMRKLRK